MLVLTRKVGERIYVGEDILIQVLEIRGPKVRIGILAPRDLKVLREELREGKEGEDAESDAAAAE